MMYTKIFSIIRGKEAFISSRLARLSATQEDLVAAEAKGEHSFPFCEEGPSASYSAESTSLVLPTNVHHGCKTMADDTFALLGGFSGSGVQAGFDTIPSGALRWASREVHSLCLHLSRK